MHLNTLAVGAAAVLIIASIVALVVVTEMRRPGRHGHPAGGRHARGTDPADIADPDGTKWLAALSAPAMPVPDMTLVMASPVTYHAPAADTGGQPWAERVWGCTVAELTDGLAEAAYGSCR